MRDRLIELLKYSRDYKNTCPKWGSNELCEGCKYDLGVECDYDGRIADHLLANGVIVPPRKGCDYCKGRAYTKRPLTVITKYGRRIELVFEFCPNCGRKMNTERSNENAE